MDNRKIEGGGGRGGKKGEGKGRKGTQTEITTGGREGGEFK